LRHDYRGTAGDGDEADLEILLLDRTAAGEYVGGGLQREKLRQRRQGGRGAKGMQERTTTDVLGKERAHNRRSDDIFVPLIVGLGLALKLWNIAVMLSLTSVTAARAPAAVQ
jgi:hypothetical protein